MATPEPGTPLLHVSVSRRPKDRAVRVTIRILGLASIIWRRRTFPADMPVHKARAEMIRYALQRFQGASGIQWRQALPMAEPEGSTDDPGQRVDPE
jgi:hypothetical protein